MKILYFLLFLTFFLFSFAMVGVVFSKPDVSGPFGIFCVLIAYCAFETSSVWLDRFFAKVDENKEKD